MLAGIIILVPKINAAQLRDLNAKLLTCGLFFAGPETEPVLVDTSASRREALEPEQLPHGYDPGPWWSGGHPGAHSLQGHLLPHVGGSLLVRETFIWPCRANWSLLVHPGGVHGSSCTDSALSVLFSRSALYSSVVRVPGIVL